jgi:hypothetical protein
MRIMDHNLNPELVHLEFLIPTTQFGFAAAAMTHT